MKSVSMPLTIRKIALDLFVCLKGTLQNITKIGGVLNYRKFPMLVGFGEYDRKSIEKVPKMFCVIGSGIKTQLIAIDHMCVVQGQGYRNAMELVGFQITGKI